MLGRIVIVVGLVGLLSGAAQAVEFELRNDGFESGGAASFQIGFATGEIAASRFTPPTGGAYQVKSVLFLFGGSAGTRTITLHVWLDPDGATPGTEVFNADYEVTAADDAMQLIDLSGDSVFVTGTFRVGIEFQHSSLPSVARDDDGIKPDTNYLLGNGLGWVESSTQGLAGDWILRTVVDGDPGALPDAGVPPPDAGTGAPDAAAGQPDAGGGGDCTANSQCPSGEYCSGAGVCTFDCRTDDDCGDDMACNSLGQCVASDSGGCGCRAASGSRSGGAAALGLLLLAAVVVGRRRR